MTGPVPDTCWSGDCRALIWRAFSLAPSARHPDGQPNAINHDPGPPCTGTGPDCTHNPKGNLAVWRDPVMGLLRWRPLRSRTRPCTCDPLRPDSPDPLCDEHGDHGGALKPGEHRGVSHWATCKDPARFRRRQGTRA